MQWFLGEEQIIGDTATEEDVPIEHTRDEDKLWFYATSFGAPLPLLILGIWIALRGRRRTGATVDAEEPNESSQVPNESDDQGVLGDPALSTDATDEEAAS